MKFYIKALALGLLLQHGDLQAACSWPSEFELTSVLRLKSLATGDVSTGVIVDIGGEPIVISTAHSVPFPRPVSLNAHTSDGHTVSPFGLDPLFDTSYSRITPHGESEPALPPGLSMVQLATRPIEFGQELFVSGYANGFKHNVVTSGFYMGRASDDASFMMSNSIYSGNSGGPVFVCEDGTLKVAGIAKSFLLWGYDNDDRETYHGLRIINLSFAVSLWAIKNVITALGIGE